MLLAEKANRRVRIADEKKDEYIGMGYTVKNMDGSLVQAPQDHKKRVQELEAELKKTRGNWKRPKGRRRRRPAPEWIW